MFYDISDWASAAQESQTFIECSLKWIYSPLFFVNIFFVIFFMIQLK